MIQPGDMITSVSALLERSLVADEFFTYDAFGVPLASGGSLDLFVSLDLLSDSVDVSVQNVNSTALGVSGFGFTMGNPVPIASAVDDQAKYTFNLTYGVSGPLFPVKVDLTFVDKSGVLAGSVGATVVLGDPLMPPTDAAVPVAIPATALMGF